MAIQTTFESDSTKICLHCGFPMRGLDFSGPCPECGSQAFGSPLKPRSRLFTLLAWLPLAPAVSFMGIPPLAMALSLIGITLATSATTRSHQYRLDDRYRLAAHIAFALNLSVFIIEILMLTASFMHMFGS